LHERLQDHSRACGSRGIVQDAQPDGSKNRIGQSGTVACLANPAQRVDLKRLHTIRSAFVQHAGCLGKLIDKPVGGDLTPLPVLSGGRSQCGIWLDNHRYGNATSPAAHAARAYQDGGDLDRLRCVQKSISRYLAGFAGPAGAARAGRGHPTQSSRSSPASSSSCVQRLAGVFSRSAPR